MTVTLIRKDVRLLRPVLWSALVLGLLFYVIGPTLVFASWRSEYIQKQKDLAVALHQTQVYLSTQTMVKEAGRTLLGASFLMWVVNLLLITTVAGMAFAVERRERWAEFAGMLPVSRARTVMAKAIASAGVCVAILGVNALVALGAITLADRWDWYVGMNPFDWQATALAIWFYVAAATGMAGVAWLLSSLLRSPVIATAAGLAMAVSVWCFLTLMVDQRNLRGADQIILQRVAMAVIFWAGLVCFTAGTVVQLRRQSP